MWRESESTPASSTLAVWARWYSGELLAHAACSIYGVVVVAVRAIEFARAAPWPTKPADRAALNLARLDTTAAIHSKPCSRRIRTLQYSLLGHAERSQSVNRRL